MTTVHTIGHGNRTADDFIALLKAARIECLVDVRAYPRSRRNPQFTRMALDPVLRAHGIQYVWEGAALGGMRRPHGDSPHAALDDAAHRGYADHMATVEFKTGVSRLIELADSRVTAFMCAETHPDHCHRSFIADALLASGVEVLHLMGQHDVRTHALREGARMAPHGQLIYDSCVQLALTL
ncbi:MAG: repair protein [Betaproteobacteria bacterium]|nr:repair protein [Betaproteobacteria bacterium]